MVINTVHSALQSEFSQLIIQENKTEALQKIIALSPREKEILGAIIDAKKTKDVVYLFYIDCHAIEVHCAYAMKKMQVISLSQLVATTAKHD